MTPLAAIATPAGELALRAETEADEPFRRALFESAWLAHGPAALLPEAVRAQLVPMQFRAQTEGHGAAYPEAERLILELDGAPVGRLMVDRSSAGIRVVDIVLAPAWRSRGLGGAALRGLTAEAAGAGLPLRLSVAAGNPGAARLYQRLGFQPTGAGDAHAEYEWRPEAT